MFDAIVVGSGMSGGWAAKELCERGLKTLVIERGRHVEHGADYTRLPAAVGAATNFGMVPEEEAGRALRDPEPVLCLLDGDTSSSG